MAAIRRDAKVIDRGGGSETLIKKPPYGGFMNGAVLFQAQDLQMKAVEDSRHCA